MGGFETRPYRGSFNVGVVMPNHVYGIVVMVGDLGIIVLARGFLHYRIWWAGLKPAPTGVRWVVVPNHVSGIVVLVGDLGLSYWHVDPGIIVL